MSSKERYFQFPLTALHFGCPITEVSVDEMHGRLQFLLSYCAIEVGKSIVRTKDEHAVDAMVNRHGADIDVEAEDLSEEERILFCGCEQLNLNLKSLDWKSHEDRYNEIVNGAKLHGSQLCRLRNDIFWQAMSGDGWTWRDLSTLCAIYAGIGRFTRAKLTYDRIGAMALGFNGQRERDACNEKCNQLTDRQTIRTVAKLKARGFFVSASPNCRHVFYSHRLSLKQLIENLAAGTASQPKASAITAAIKARAEQLKSEAIATI